MGVVVKESEEGVFELWEFGGAGEALLVLEVVVKEMDGFWFE